MRIGIDARFVGAEGTGLGKYTEKLILNLAQIDNKNQYFIFLRQDNWSYLPITKFKNFQKVLADIPWYSVSEQLKMPQIFKAQNLGLLHVPHFNVPIFFKGKFVVTIHDLIHHQFHQAATTRHPLIFNAKRLSYRYVINQAVKKAVKIISPSNHVREQIIQTFKIDPSKVIVTYEAAEEEYLQQSQKSKVKSQKLLQKYKIKTPFIIYVGNAYPHKNLEMLLEAFKIFVHSPRSTVYSKEKTMNHELSTMNLVIVCPRDVFWQRLKKMINQAGLEDKVIMTGYIPALKLSQIFKYAQAYVFPSLAEGFGIPGLNAMAASTPVVCSKIPTLIEVYGKAALYFDPNDPKDIAFKITQILTDTNIRPDLIERGSEQVKKYSWRQMAQETLKIYQYVCRRPSGFL